MFRHEGLEEEWEKGLGLSKENFTKKKVKLPVLGFRV